MEGLTLVAIVSGSTYLVLLVVMAVLVYLQVSERKSHRAERSELLNRFMAKDLHELAATKQALEATPKDVLRQTEAENELAQAGAKIAENEQLKYGGVPIT